MGLLGVSTLPVGRNGDDHDSARGSAWVEGDGRWPDPRVRAYLPSPGDAASHISSPHPQSTLPCGEMRYTPVVWPLSQPRPREHFKALESWEGCVLAVEEEAFRARVTSSTSGQEEEAEFPLEELDEEDVALVQPGAVFYGSIGYLDRPTGRIKASVIRFRRLPAWTRRELEEARAVAAELATLFDDGPL